MPVSVVNDQWCWKTKSINVEITDSDLTSVDFTQTGFMLSASLSHSILLVCTLYQAPVIVLQYKIMTRKQIKY